MSTPCEDTKACLREACNNCGAKVKCPVAVFESPVTCRAVKYAAALLYFTAYGLIFYTSKRVDTVGLTGELGVLLLLRTTVITCVFGITMWAMNHVIKCACAGGVLKSRLK